MNIVHDQEMNLTVSGGYIDGRVALIDSKYYAYLFNSATGRVSARRNEFAKHNKSGVVYVGTPFDLKHKAIEQVEAWNPDPHGFN